MASDLSQIIPNNLASTLNALLGKETSLKQCTKVDIRDFDSTQVLRVDTEFVFEKLTTIFSYYIPANSASEIFNMMMGASDHDIATIIDDDTSDAMTEFISNTCGGLVTTINAEEFEDLGKSKFNIKHKEIVDTTTITSVDNIYKFVIDVEDKEVILFTEFQENFLDFILELSNSPVSFYPEVEEKQEEEQEEQDEDAPIENEENDNSEEEVEEENNGEDSKSKKLKLVIIILASLISTILIATVIMYFSGTFDSEPVQEEMKTDTNNTKEIKNNVDVVNYPEVKKIDFKTTDINIPRLNKRLELLTKYQVLNQVQLEAQVLEEKERLNRLKKEQELIKFAKENKEEPLIIKKELPKKEKIPTKTIPETKEITKETITQEKIEEVTKATPNTEIKLIDENLKFVLASSLKYKLFKSLVKETNSTQARISICSNEDGKTNIYIGPFENEELQLKMNALIQNADQTIETTISNITLDQFNTRCNF